MIKTPEFPEDSKCKIDENELKFDFCEFYSILREDWLKVDDPSRIRNLTQNVKVYQVISCFDVSVPKYRIENLDTFEDDKDDDDFHKSSYKSSKNKRSTRMLKLVLFDGDSKYLAFEYEPVGAFDLLYDSELNCMSRCCVKIALYNSPPFRRNSFWLTNSNVKLLFQGYSCKIFSPNKTTSSEITETNMLFDDQKPVDINMLNQQKVKPEVDFSTNLFEDDNVVEFNLNEIKTTTTKFDRIEDITDLEINKYLNKLVDFRGAPDVKDYFSPQSNYIDHSFLCLIKKLGLPFSNESFLRFSRERFLDKFNNLDVNLTNLLKILNFSCTIENTTCDFTGPYSRYQFGFLNHSSVVMPDQLTPLSKLLSFVSENIFGSLEKKVWLAIFDDCVACTFCIFTLDVFPFVSHLSDELTISLELNSLEGFFLLEDFLFEGGKIKVLKDFIRSLPPDELAERARIINEEYHKIKRDFNF